MTWVKLDDGFTEHPKVLGLSDAAFRLHLAALCYAARNLTDGIIPRVWLKGAKPMIMLAVAQLIGARLWAEHADGWEVHDYLHYQQSRAQVEQSRERNNTRVKRHRNALHDRDSNGSETLPRIDPIRSDPKEQIDPTSAIPQMPLRSPSTTTPRHYDRTHAGHLNGFCDFKCFSEEKAQLFAKDLPGGQKDSENFNRVLAWAEHLRDTWGDQPKLEFEWFKFWEARWKERSGSLEQSDASLQRLIARVAERLS